MRTAQTISWWGNPKADLTEQTSENVNTMVHNALRAQDPNYRHITDKFTSKGVQAKYSYVVSQLTGVGQQRRFALVVDQFIHSLNQPNVEIVEIDLDLWQIKVNGQWVDPNTQT